MSEPKKLYRSRKQRLIAGVCGGIAEYFNTDPTIVRLIAVILLFASAFVPFVIVYIIMAAIVPEAPIAKSQPKAKVVASKTKASKTKA